MAGVASTAKARRFALSTSFRVILKAMEVHFTPEEDARFRAAAREGIAQADKGEFLEEAEMDARLEQILR
jgi:predicted transcriptional regulator